MVQETERKPRFIVGIDFGTTFTSVAFVHSSAPNDVKLVRDWPGFSSDQVPTTLHYTTPSTRHSIWGYEIRGKSRDAPEPLRWFKLLLQERFPSSSPSSNDTTLLSPASSIPFDLDSSPARKPTPAARTASQLQKLDIQPVDAVTDFLEHVRKCTLKCMGNSYKAEFVTCSKIEYVVTIPAIWTDAAKDMMVRALEAAGYGAHRLDFGLVSEPEAAAAYAFKAIQPQSLEIGDCFVVCDAGGGTCDLISYQVDSLIPMQLREVVSGTGDLCGSVYLDHRFESYICHKFGHKLIDAMSPSRKFKMMASWEEDVKLNFGNAVLGEFDVYVPGVPDSDVLEVFDGYHEMETEDIEGIFEPVVARIRGMVRAQCEAIQRKGFKVAAILLVGGFGSSVYLRDYLHSTTYGGQGVQVIQPANARSAIARGALVRGLDGSIVRERRSRLHYGTMYSEFHSHIAQPRHIPSDKSTWDPHTEAWYINDRMNWFINKEETVTSESRVHLGLIRTVWVPENPDAKLSLLVRMRLLAYSADNAPKYLWEDKDNMRTVCVCTSDLSEIDRSRFPIRTNSQGRKYYQVKFKHVVSMVNEVLQFELYFEGERFGLATAKFE